MPLEPKLRVLIISPHFPPENFSEAIATGKLVLSMLASGWDVAVITGTFGGPNYTNKGGWTDPWSALRSHVTHVGEAEFGSKRRAFERVRSTLFLGHMVPHVRWSSRAVQEGLRLAATSRFDAVISRAVAGWEHLAALKLARMLRIPWLANWNDPPGMIAPASYAIEQGAFETWQLRRLLKRVLATATVNTFPSDRLATWILERLCHGRPKGEIAVVPHNFVEGAGGGGDSTSSSFRVCHVGNLSAERDPRTLLHGWNLFVDSLEADESVSLEFIGRTDPSSASAIEQVMGRGRCIVTGPYEYLETRVRIAQCSVGLVIEGAADEGVFLPSKITDYVQLRKPILSVSPASGVMKDLLSRFGGGIATDVKSPANVAQALRTLHAAWKARTLSRWTSDSLRSYLAGETVVGAYERLIRLHANKRHGCSG